MKLLGKGNTAEVFEYADGKVCKLFYEGYPREYVELEFQNAKDMYNSKIKIPEPFQTVTVENRHGIIYEKIEGETLLNIMNADGENFEEYLEIFVKLHQDIVSWHTKNALSYKEYLTKMVKSKTTDYRIVLDKIKALPDDDCILHGDFHPNNILINKDGEPIVIDFMNVCYGPALYDVARTYFLIKQYNDNLAERYLKKMNVSKGNIAEYMDIIELCHKYES